MIILHVETFQRLMPHAIGSMVTNSIVVCPGVEQTYPFEATLFAHYHCTLTLQWMPEIIWNAPNLAFLLKHILFDSNYARVVFDKMPNRCRHASKNRQRFAMRLSNISRIKLWW